MGIVIREYSQGDGFSGTGFSLWFLEWPDEKCTVWSQCHWLL